MFQVNVTASDLARGLNGEKIFEIRAIEYTGHSARPFRITVEILNDAPGAEDWRPNGTNNPQD